MLDPDIRRLLDTVFNVPPGTAEPDVAQLRAAAEIAPELLGGEPLAIGSIADASVPGDAATVAVRIYRPSAGSPMPVSPRVGENRAHWSTFARRAPVFAAVSLCSRDSQALPVRPPSTLADARFAPGLRPARMDVLGAARRAHWSTFALRAPVFVLGAARRAHAG